MYAIGRLLESLLPDGTADDDLRLLVEVATAVEAHVETLGAGHPDTRRLATLSRTPLAGGD